MIKTAVHEMHHAMGGGFACVPGMSKKAHFKSGQDTDAKPVSYTHLTLPTIYSV